MVVYPFQDYSCLFEVPWIDEAPAPVEWLFDKPRPDLAARLIANLSNAVVVSGEQASGKRSSSGSVPAAKRQKTGTSAQTIDSLKMVSSDVTPATAPGSSRPLTFADMLLHCVDFIIRVIDQEFSNAASVNMLLILIEYCLCICFWIMVVPVVPMRV